MYKYVLPRDQCAQCGRCHVLLLYIAILKKNGGRFDKRSWCGQYNIWTRCYVLLFHIAVLKKNGRKFGRKFERRFGRGFGWRLWCKEYKEGKKEEKTKSKEYTCIFFVKTLKSLRCPGYIHKVMMAVMMLGNAMVVVGNNNNDTG